MKGEGKLHQNDMGERPSHNHSPIWFALWFGGIGGLANIVVDLDHWFNTNGFAGWGLAGRPLHVPLAILAGCLGVYSYTRLRRWSAKLVLKWVLIVLAIIAVLVGLEIVWAIFMWNV